MEESHLDAEALCQSCFEPFGQLEDLRAPFVIACGHVICLGCLNTDVFCCGICGAPFERQIYSRLLDLNDNPTKILFDSNQLAQQLQESIALVNDHTAISHIQHLYERARRFVDSQPRNRFKDLATSVCLLGCLLQSKETLKAHSRFSNNLTERIHILQSERQGLLARIDELDRQKCDHASIMLQLPNIMRRNPDVMHSSNSRSMKH
ncbi:hypothetical protein CPB84DRAFT_157047 [Gymnopilus junonius]|uniref:RING-type domain-containing protein n=1 Tax=Gymnopilus junonius TaxID=109634 RepID=A0A9P5NEY7_GYMJU|nr:hypothetical protein CPB84DRAFT_157047 [Gymnopilus junonius]